VGQWAEFVGTQPGALAIDAPAGALLVALERAAPRPDAQRAERGSARQCTWNVTELVDASHCAAAVVGAALQLGITPTQLNRCAASSPPAGIVTAACACCSGAA
jgi:hypothetical protein